MAFRKIKGSFKNRDITTHVLEDTYLAHDTVTGQLRIGDGVTPGGTLVTTGGSSSLTVQDEGTSLDTSATTLNFVGDGVEVTGSGATKTITILQVIAQIRNIQNHLHQYVKRHISIRQETNYYHVK